ncbi:hypothetical protein DSECCO2_547970 [anaerobic digester metagenome]
MTTTQIIADAIIQIAENNDDYGRFYTDYDGYTFFLYYDFEEELEIDQIIYEYSTGRTAVLEKDPDWFDRELFLEVVGKVVKKRLEEISEERSRIEEAEIEARAIEKTNDYLRSCGDTTSKYL